MEDSSSEPTFPGTSGQLRAWLRDTDAGHEILRDAAGDFLDDACRRCQRGQPYPKVLVIAREWDGMPGVEVIHEKGVSVKLVEKGNGMGGWIKHTITTEHGQYDKYFQCHDGCGKTLEDLAERTLALTLPRSWRNLLLGHPASQCSTICCTGLTVDRAIEILDELQELRDIQEFTRQVALSS